MEKQEGMIEQARDGTDRLVLSCPDTIGNLSPRFDGCIIFEGIAFGEYSTLELSSMLPVIVKGVCIAVLGNSSDLLGLGTGEPIDIPSSFSSSLVSNPGATPNGKGSGVSIARSSSVFTRASVLSKRSSFLNKCCRCCERASNLA
jgi:hypothetical protein